MRYGYFDDSNREYVITRPDTPLPWLKYLGCEDYFGLISKLTPVGLRGGSIEELIPMTIKLKDAGIEELVLDPGSRNLLEAIRDQIFVRKAALKQGFRPLGYPTIAFPCFLAKDGLKEMLVGSAFISKWASIIVFSDFDQYSLLPLLVQRLNIYTDPRFPMAVEEK